ncbi:MAG: enoyl-CoA hydratase-related protein, partial [Paracoccaceae bacterium]
MDRYETLALARDARGVLTITLNRPDKKNALSGQMIADLTHIAEVIEKDKDIRVAVLRGAGDVFCAGGDLGW